MPYKYHGNIWIDDTSRAYRREVERYLDLIRGTRAGRTLIRFIGLKPRWVFIVPRRPTKDDPINAFASPKNAADAYAKDYVRTRDVNLLGLMTLKMPTGVVGTGSGSPVWVRYHPATWRQLNANMGGVAPGDGPAEVLFHEMVHAMRMLNGLLSDDVVPEDIRMDDVEELYAILAANVYRSERGFKLMRRDHWGSDKLDALADPELYYDHFKRPIDEWFTAQRAFCMAMAESSAKFNPFKEAAIALGYMKRPPFPMALPPHRHP
jgi:hypothetical protein